MDSSIVMLRVVGRRETRAALRARPVTRMLARTQRDAPWLWAWISVVDRVACSASTLPFESIRCDAKSVLMSVDLPRPVWPAQAIATRCEKHAGQHTDPSAVAGCGARREPSSSKLLQGKQTHRRR